MKPNFNLSSFLAGSALLALSTQSHAAARYWDAGSPTSGPASAASGTWTQTGNQWRTSATVGSQTAYSTGTTPQQAAFVAGTVSTNYTVTVSGTVHIQGNSNSIGQAGIYAVGDGNYIFDGTGTIQLGSATTNIHTNSNEQFSSGLTVDNNGQTLVISAGGLFDAKITGAGALSYTGGVTLTLNNASNDYSGGTTIAGSAGGIVAFVNGGLGTTGSITISNSNLRWQTGNNQDISSRLVMLNGGIARFNTNGNDVSFANGIGSSSTSNLTKSGNGKLTISGVNSYSGTTSVTGGTLAVNGTLASSGVTVATGATLEGDSSITGTVNIQGNGTLASGNNGIGSLATGALTLQGTSTLAYQVRSNAAPDGAGDLTAVTGNLTIGSGAILAITDLDIGSWSFDEKLTLISYTGLWNDGLFSYDDGSGLAVLEDDSIFSFGGSSWMINYNDNDEGGNFIDDLTGTNFVTMTVIPETSTALLSGLGALALLRRRRN